MKTFPLRVAPHAGYTPGVHGGGWQVAQLWASPHRLGFMAGSVMLVVSALWWWMV